MGISWKNNRLGIKIFRFGLGMYLIFSILVYFVIYNGIPIFYQYYKEADFNKRVNYVINNSSDVDSLGDNINEMLRKTSISVRYEYDGFVYDCMNYMGYNNCRPIIEQSQIEFGDEFAHREDYLSRTEILVINDKDLTINFRSAKSSTDEVQNILFLFLPVFGILSVSMAFLLAYYISKRLSDSILKLRNDAKSITSLNFDIEQSVKSNDELGDLSYSLVVLANTLNKTLNELQEANEKLYDDIEKERIKEEERRAYIATISHDLKTPLTAIKGQLEGMLYNVGKYKDHETYLKNNIELTNDMEEMIQSIIISSKLDDYNTELFKQKTYLKRLIDNSLDELDYLVTQKDLKIDLNIPDDYNVEVDASLFGRALNNLIGNAIEYADEKTNIKIYLDNNILNITNVTSDFDELLIAKQLIFKPFYRQDKSRNKNGSGLGMYIVKKICDLHNISINITYKNDIFKLSLVLKEKNDVL